MGLKEILEHHIVDHAWSWLAFGPLRLPVSKHFLMMAIASVIMLVFFPLIIRSRSRALAPARGMLEMMVVFIREDIVIPNLGHKGVMYLGYFCTLFFFILLLNLLGMVPFGASATGNLAVTAGLSITAFIMINLAGIREQGVLGYIAHLVPKGVPWWLYPLLFPIELIGLVTKAFALCIRLFANMIAGHIVILAFVSFIFIFGGMHVAIGYGVAPVSIALVLFISLLEVFVAFLQAYVFTFLTAIFTGASMHPH